MEPWSNIKVLLITSFGLGSFPIGPGSWGTLPAVGIYALIVSLTPDSSWHTWLLTIALAGTCGLCLWLAPWAENHWGSKDPRQFVLDEVAGFFVTVLLFSTNNLETTIFWAFIASRLFDIVKPPPAAQMEKLPGGWGILLDDIVASLYAALFLNVAKWLIPSLFGAA